jgi:release factor glutamine methyltransferase
MIYEPREDSLLLQKHVRKYAHGSVVDMGSGSGIQAETALEKTKDVLAVDIDDDVIAHLKKKHLNVIKSDLFSKVPKKKFDLIIFNPPYLPEDKRERMEDRLALTGGKYGWEILDRFFKEAKNFLSPEGKILIVFSSITGDVDFILKKYGYTFEKLDKQSFFFEKLIVYLISPQP